MRTDEVMFQEADILFRVFPQKRMHDISDPCKQDGKTCAVNTSRELIAEIPEWDTLLKGKVTFYLLLSLIWCERRAMQRRIHNLLMFVSHQIRYLYSAYEVSLLTGRLQGRKKAGGA